jgi:hypothetical protein
MGYAQPQQYLDTVISFNTSYKEATEHGGTLLGNSLDSLIPEEYILDGRANKPHFRKFSPIDREHPIFELVEDDTVLFDISRSDAGEVEVALHAGGANRIFAHNELIRLLHEGRRLVEDDIVTTK